jgi:hypothetical protein
MNVGPLAGTIGSAAGAPLSQTAGSEPERTSRDGTTQQRQVDAEQKAEMAAGIGQTREDQESSERDADGRRPWESPTKKNADVHEENDVASSATPVRQSKDATGQCGNQLDLTG